MLNDNFTTVSSVAFGQFRYGDKLQIAGIEKMRYMVLLVSKHRI